MKVSWRHFGAGVPPGGQGSGGRLVSLRGTGVVPHWGVQRAKPWKQNGFEVFALAENGSPERNANNLESCFIPHFIILLDSTPYTSTC